MALEPGEPVPPGLEQVVIANCQIQPIIDAYTSGPLIGLEYLVELNSDFETDLEYICMLCEKVGRNRSILGHLTSQGHYKRYIVSVYLLMKFLLFYKILKLIVGLFTIY